MFWNNYYNLCLQKGISPNAAAKDMKISSGAVTEWKKGRVPHHGTLLKIADFFGVSVDYLLRPTITEIAQAGDEDSDITPPPVAKTVYVTNPAFKKFIAGARGEPRIEKSNLVPLSPNYIYSIPVVESVSAGFGVLAIDDVIDYMPLYITSSAEAEETICIKVKGDSMYPKIENGDIIQVHKQTDVDSGSIAVIRLENEEFLVKKVQFGHNWIELHSINPTYPPLRFEGPAAIGVHIVGLVKKIIKNV